MKHRVMDQRSNLMLLFTCLYIYIHIYTHTLEIEFLDILVYKDKLQGSHLRTLFKRKTDQQPYLHSKSDHPVSLKKSIPYSQILPAKRICPTKSEFERIVK